ncbi:Flp pilus assembly protein CpaB [Nocardioides sp.]|uniref:Flp pilus assembly protein CpaB n=1 Tax=Nocardioides sp. TaxID=35761 RepID=UPI003D15072D
MARRGILLTVAAIIAALGTLLVFLYVNGADDRAAEPFETVDVLRAVKVIAPGETVEDAQAAGKFELQPVPKNQVLAGSLADTTSLEGKVATTTIYPGEQIIASKFGGTAESNVLPIPKGMMAVTVNLTDPARVAGFVSPGAEVAIFYMGNDARKQDQAFARMMLPRVTVLGVGSTAPGKTTTTATDGTATTEVLPNALLTIAVSKEDAERVLYATKNAEIAFGLLTEDSEVPQGPGIYYPDVFKSELFK